MESVEYLLGEAGNESVDIRSISEPEELGTTHDLSVGGKIELHWHLDDQDYSWSKSEYHENTGTNKIAYDEGQLENLNMKNETWGILSTKQVSIPDLASIDKQALQTCFQTLAHKEFMLY